MRALRYLLALFSTIAASSYLGSVAMGLTVLALQSKTPPNGWIGSILILIMAAGFGSLIPFPMCAGFFLTLTLTLTPLGTFRVFRSRIRLLIPSRGFRAG